MAVKGCIGREGIERKEFIEPCIGGLNRSMVLSIVFSHLEDRSVTISLTASTRLPVAAAAAAATVPAMLDFLLGAAVLVLPRGNLILAAGIGISKGVGARLCLRCALER